MRSSRTRSSQQKSSSKSLRGGIPGNYPWMSLSSVLRYVPEMERYKVSEVARSQRGFLTQYKKARGNWRQLNEYWQRRRMNFVKRHLAQYNPNPTYRHYLALIAWAYMPSKKPANKPARSSKAEAGAARTSKAKKRTTKRNKAGKVMKMPRRYSKAYCLKTACDKMGFTQRASCRPYKNCYNK